MTVYCTSSISSYKMLGVKCNAITVPELMEYFDWAISTEQHNHIVTYHNIHSVYLYHHEPDMRRFYEKGSITYIDGMPLIFWGMLMGFPLKRQNRTPFLVWNEIFFSLAESKGWRIYYVGGRQSSIDKGAQIMKDRYPNLSIRFHNGYLTDKDIPALYEDIREFRPNVLLVGMGMPIQERWILNAYEHVRANIIVNGGAMIEYITGDQLPSPRWLGQLGMEWAYRLLTQPKRLAYRYLIEPFHILDLFCKDLVTHLRERT